MAAAEPEIARYCFLVEWFDPTSKLTRSFQLSFCPSDETVEMYDLKNKKIFLKRTRIQDVSLQDLYIGSAVNIFSRQLVIVGYGDAFTQNALGKSLESLCVVIGPAKYAEMGNIIDHALKAGFYVAGIRMLDEGVLKGSPLQGAVT